MPTADRRARVSPAQETPKRRGKRVLDLHTKHQILRRLDGGEGASAIGRAYGINESTVRTIRANREAILASLEHATTPPPPATPKATKTSRNPLVEKVEAMLVEWMEDNDRKHIGLDSVAIRAKAQKIYDQLKREEGGLAGAPEFGASKGWFDNFRRRHSLRDMTITDSPFRTPGSPANSWTPDNNNASSATGEAALDSEQGVRGSRGHSGWENSLRPRPAPRSSFQAGPSAGFTPPQPSPKPPRKVSTQAIRGEQRSPVATEMGVSSPEPQGHHSPTALSPLPTMPSNHVATPTSSHAKEEPDEGSSSSLSSLSPSLSSSPLGVADLVWGKIKGYSWWPGCTVSWIETGRDAATPGSSWIRWFGDCKFSMVQADKLRPLAEFNDHFHWATYNKRTAYKRAVYEALKGRGEPEPIPADTGRKAGLYTITGQQAITGQRGAI